MRRAVALQLRSSTSQPVTAPSSSAHSANRSAKHAAQELAQDQRVHQRRPVLGLDRGRAASAPPCRRSTLAGEVGLVGAGAVVVGAARADRQAQRHRLQRPRLVAGDLQPLRRAARTSAPAARSSRPRAACPRRAARRGRSRAPISSSARSSASPSPKRSHGASIRPRSAHSIAKAIVPPAEIVSRPSSSQRALAASTTSGSATPHSGPRANTFSYSTRASPPPLAA